MAEKRRCHERAAGGVGGMGSMYIKRFLGGHKCCTTAGFFVMAVDCGKGGVAKGLRRGSRCIQKVMIHKFVCATVLATGGGVWRECASGCSGMPGMASGLPIG